jgi:hypothetical protein
MSLLPANPTARRREEEIRERARAEAFERGYAHGRAYGTTRLQHGEALVASPLPSPSPPTRSLALDIGQDRILLPPAVTVSRTLVDQGEIATHISFGHVTLTIEEALHEGVIDLAGRYSHFRAGAVLHSRPQSGWVHPMGHDATRPATRPRP